MNNRTSRETELPDIIAEFDEIVATLRKHAFGRPRRSLDWAIRESQNAISDLKMYSLSKNTKSGSNDRRFAVKYVEIDDLDLSQKAAAIVWMDPSIQGKAGARKAKQSGLKINGFGTGRKGSFITYTSGDPKKFINWLKNKGIDVSMEKDSHAAQKAINAMDNKKIAEELLKLAEMITADKGKYFTYKSGDDIIYLNGSKKDFIYFPEAAGYDGDTEFVVNNRVIMGTENRSQSLQKGGKVWIKRLGLPQDAEKELAWAFIAVTKFIAK